MRICAFPCKGWLSGALYQFMLQGEYSPVGHQRQQGGNVCQDNNSWVSPHPRLRAQIRHAAAGGRAVWASILSASPQAPNWPALRRSGSRANCLHPFLHDLDN